MSLGRLPNNAPVSVLPEAGAGTSRFTFNAADFGFPVNVTDTAPLGCFCSQTVAAGRSGGVDDENLACVK